MLIGIVAVSFTGSPPKQNRQHYEHGEPTTETQREPDTDPATADQARLVARGCPQRPGDPLHRRRRTAPDHQARRGWATNWTIASRRCPSVLPTPVPSARGKRPCSSEQKSSTSMEVRRPFRPGHSSTSSKTGANYDSTEYR